MTKDKKERNPADAFRKEQRKKEIAKAKKDRTVVREVRDLLNDPKKIDDEIQRVQKQSDENKLDKSLKDRIKELKAMKTVSMKKQLVMEASGKRPTLDGDVQTQQVKADVVIRKPEDSVYFHPIYNQSGAPPPGQPELYKPQGSSIHRPPPHNLPRPVAPHEVLHNQQYFQQSVPVPPPPPLPAHMKSAPFPQHPQYLLPPRPMFAYPIPGPPPPRPHIHPGIVAQQPINYNAFGIPPPPPMQPPVQQSQQSVGRAHQHHQQQQKNHREAAVDPLDPSAKGYTERFGMRESSVQQQRTNSGAEGQSSSASLQINSAHFPEAQVIMQGRQIVVAEEQESEEDGDTVTEGGDEDREERLAVEQRLAAILASKTQPSTVEPALNHAALSDSCDSNVPYAVPSAEELLRRRFAVPTETSREIDEAGPAVGPSRPSVEVYEEVGPDVGPSRPSLSEYAPSICVGEESGQWGDEDEAQDVEDVFVESAPRLQTGLLSAAPLFKAPLLNLTMVKPTVPTGLLGLLGQYGDDDEEDEEQEDEEEKRSDAPPAVFHYHSVPPMPPVPSLSTTHTAPVLSTLPSSVAVGSKPAALYPSLGGSAIPMPASLASSSTAPNGFVKGPRIVKTDAAVTRLVPNVLKMKRQQLGAQPPPKVAKTIHQPSVSSGAAVQSSAEEAYNSFMSEISGLGATDDLY